jgi:hypothetical protein
MFAMVIVGSVADLALLYKSTHPLCTLLKFPIQHNQSHHLLVAVIVISCDLEPARTGRTQDLEPTTSD